MTLTPGQPAPPFSLFDTGKNKISLEDFKGRNILLLFFPQAFTGVCTKELCSIRDDIGNYNNINNTVIGISVDSVFTLQKFKEEQQYNFSLLSDFNKEVSTAYGCLYENWILDMKGVSKRASFIIDKQGIIKYVQVLENAMDFPDFDTIRRTLESLP